MGPAGSVGGNHRADEIDCRESALAPLHEKDDGCGFRKIALKSNLKEGPDVYAAGNPPNNNLAVVPTNFIFLKTRKTAR
ncbi:MAG: hypothetical protein ALAOOOJD_02371 [bacterium]|nr:hypothetical protein [bacterium]